MKSARAWVATVRRRWKRGAATPTRGGGPTTSYKVVAATRLLDEADIIEAFVRHTACYADTHIFLDNGSTDGTLEILTSLRDEGFDIVVYQNTSAIFREHQFNTFLYREANKLGSSWTIFLDADEFIDDRAHAGGLPGYMRTTYDDPVVFAFWIALKDYRLTERDWAGELNVAKRLRHRRAVSGNKKITVRGGLGDNVTIGGGSHDVYVDGTAQPVPLLEHVTYAHFPERSSYQYFTKNVRGWMKVLASAKTLRDGNYNNHYKAPFELLRDQPDQFFNNPAFMKQHNELDDLTFDPIDYRGGELRYTKEDYNTEAMRSIRILAQYIQQLACQHGALLDSSKQARALVEGWSSRIERIL